MNHRGLVYEIVCTCVLCVCCDHGTLLHVMYEISVYYMRSTHPTTSATRHG